jgi:hypothetical protein
MSPKELLSALVDELPTPTPVVPCVFLADDLLPRAFVPMEPAAFTLACLQALWGVHGPCN